MGLHKPRPRLPLRLKARTVFMSINKVIVVSESMFLQNLSMRNAS